MAGFSTVSTAKTGGYRGDGRWEGETHTGTLLPKIIMFGFLGITTFMRYLFDAGGYTCFVYTIE